MTSCSVRRLSILAGVLLCVSAAAGAQESKDTVRVDVHAPPWTAVGQVNNSAYGRCTGVLLSRRMAVTAAHCLFNKGTGRFLPPEAIHFVLGYDRGAFAFQTVAASITVGQGFEPERALETMGHDWALLELRDDAPADTAPLLPVDRRPATGAALVSAGFGQSRLYALTATRPCPVLGRGPDGTLAVGCAIQHGYSGGPLLDADNRLAGIQVAGGRIGERDVAFAVPAETWARASKR